jgi:hypothetical protein
MGIGKTALFIEKQCEISQNQSWFLKNGDGNRKTGTVYRKTVRDFTKAVLVSKNTMGNGKPALFFEKQCGI